MAKTELSEFSPTPRPGQAGFTTVRVEADGRQRLWHFDPEKDDAELLFPDLEPVGSFAWIDHDHVAAFILGEPATLQVAGPSGPVRRLAGPIDRSLHRLPDGRVAYIDLSTDPPEIRAVRAPDGQVATLAALPGETQDIAVGPDGAIWTATGSVIRRFSGGAWDQVADLADHGVRDISRLAVSPDGDRLVFVATED